MSLSNRSLLFGPEANFFKVWGEFLLENLKEQIRFRRAGGKFDPGVYVLGIFTENDHVDFFRALYRAWYSVKILHGAQAYVQIQ